MDKNSNKFVMLFATAVCVVLAVALAGAYSALIDRITANQEFDRQRNILKAVGLWDPATDDFGRPELEKLFADRMRSEVLEVKRETREVSVRRAGVEGTEMREVVVDVVKTDLDATKLAQVLREEGKKPAAERREFVPFYTSLDEGGAPSGYCIPISGYGLWSTLYGYLALEADCNTTRGITFYQHGETPGLGGEVDNPSWQAQWSAQKTEETGGQWVRRRILDDEGHLVSVVMRKGPADPADPHAVDGLSGATITANGVNAFVRRDLQTYGPYLEKLR